MAITYTPKLKLPLYSDGNDKHPGRLDNNALMNLIESNVLGSSQGLHASRPGADTPGRAYFSTDRATLAYDNGTAWVDLVPIGGVVPSGVIVGSVGSEGTSARVARADHSHAIQLATSAVHGLMPSADKSKLDKATTNATANTVALRDASGRISIGAPTVAAHAATKSYVDSTSSNASNLSTGTVDPARIANASSTADGLMSKADKIKLDGATVASTGSTIPLRDASGNVRYGVVVLDSPQSSSGNTAARKDYVDAQIGTRAPASHNHDGGDITSGLINQARIANATSSLNGLMSNVDKIKLDSATANANPNTIAYRNADGLMNVATPVYSANATTKAYVDGQITAVGNASANAVHKHDAADITTGVLAPARIPVATQSVHGAMSAADKLKLDRASSLATANTLVMNDANGRFQVVTPSGSTDAANKSYVDNKVWSGSDITTGTISPLRIANASSTVDGLMSKADKAKLDAATPSTHSDAIVRRDSNGRANIATPLSSSQIANMGYVDGKFADVFIGTELPDGANLNNYITPNLYHNSANASIATGSNYPSGTAGKLEVSKNASSTMIYQVWTEYSSTGSIYYRTRYSGTWYAWKELAKAGSNVLSTSANDTTLNGLKSPGTSYLYTGYGPYRDARLIEVFADTAGNVFQRDSRTGAVATNVRIRGFDVVSGLWSGWTNL